MMHNTTSSDDGRARVLRENGDTWGLVLVRQLRHAPEIVWRAITDPTHLREWAPFDADADMGTAGTHVSLSTVGAPQQSTTTVVRADKPRLLIYNWGGNEMRWELEPTATGTQLTLWTRIDHRYIAMGAAGWHLCFDVLGAFLEGTSTGRVVGRDALASPRWQQLHAEYTREFSSE
ncbi:MAG: SRPBCC domain-containing protein [Gemmatimonadaceae bacterium]|nr:SRPBCC domain-containing protein [Gemmatimonadaceae bacterium]